MIFIFLVTIGPRAEFSQLSALCRAGSGAVVICYWQDEIQGGDWRQLGMGMASETKSNSMCNQVSPEFALIYVLFALSLQKHT